MRVGTGNAVCQADVFLGIDGKLGGVAVALFPSNYEIIGMSDSSEGPTKKKSK